MRPVQFETEDGRHRVGRVADSGDPVPVLADSVTVLVVGESIHDRPAGIATARIDISEAELKRCKSIANHTEDRRPELYG